MLSATSIHLFTGKGRSRDRDRGEEGGGGKVRGERRSVKKKERRWRDGQRSEKWTGRIGEMDREVENDRDREGGREILTEERD